MNSSELALSKRHLSATYTGTWYALSVTSNVAVPRSERLSLDLWKEIVAAVLQGHFLFLRTQQLSAGALPNTMRHTSYLTYLVKSVKIWDKEKMFLSDFSERGRHLLHLILLGCEEIHTKEQNGYSRVVSFNISRLEWVDWVTNITAVTERRTLQLRSQTWPWGKANVRIYVLCCPSDTMSQALVIGNHVVVIWSWSELKFCSYRVRSGHSGVFHKSNSQVVSFLKCTKTNILEWPSQRPELDL